MEVLLGAFAYLFFRCIVSGFYTVDANERAVKIIFGKAQRKLRLREASASDEKSGNEEGVSVRNFSDTQYPALEVIRPGLHFKFPWEKIKKISVATETIDLGYDFENYQSDSSTLEAVTRDQLNIRLKGQIRYRVSEANLYAYLFGIKNPITHVMGYFVSILRERIANFESPEVSSESTQDVDKTSKYSNPESRPADATEGVSVNHLRKNLREINDNMLIECQQSESRYGIVLDASLITGIDSPAEVESALAAINTAYNNVSSEISLAKASADQTLVQSKRAVEIETLKVQAEVEPLVALAKELKLLKARGPGVLEAFVRNARLGLFKQAEKVVIQAQLKRSINEK